MAGTTAGDQRSDGQGCYRCGDPLNDSRWARLSATHRNPHADRYADVETRICLDCLAGIGLLEFAGDRPERSTRSKLRARLPSVRSER